MNAQLTRESQLKPAKLASFKKWLLSRGAELLTPTNPWEIVRFKARGVTAVIYRDRAGALSLIGPALEAWQAFSTAQPWDGAAKTVNRPKRTPLVKALIVRDGDACFYCGKQIGTGEETIEHLVPIICGGTNHIANLALAHAACNREAGNLSVVEKVAIRDRVRASLAMAAE